MLLLWLGALAVSMQRSGEGGWCNGAQPLLPLVCLGLYYYMHDFVLGGMRGALVSWVA